MQGTTIPTDLPQAIACAVRCSTHQRVFLGQRPFCCYQVLLRISQVKKPLLENTSSSNWTVSMMELLLEIKLTVKYIYKCKKKKKSTTKQGEVPMHKLPSAVLPIHCPALPSLEQCLHTLSLEFYTRDWKVPDTGKIHQIHTFFFPPKTDLVFHGQTAGQLATASGSLGSVSLLAALGDRSVCTSLQRALQTLPGSHNALGTPQQH